MAFNVEIKGLRELQLKMNQLPAEVRVKVSAVLENGADNWVALAKKDAPVGVGGFLKNQIRKRPTTSGAMTYEVVSGANYSPYMEWGTKKRYKPIPGTEAYAAEFRGKGQGDYYEFLNNILDWVKHKGKYRGSISAGKVTASKKTQNILIAEARKAAYFIMKFGVKPHPYFFKHMATVVNMINAGIQRAIAGVKL